jgi:1,4-alpha-glucan branching enzyme
MKFKSNLTQILTLLCCILTSTSTFSYYKDDWTKSFYTDDSSLYLTLYADGFKQLVRVNQEACGQIKDIDIVFKDTSKNKSNTTSVFSEITKTSAPKLYGINPAAYCWYEVETRGMSYNSAGSLKYVLKIQDLGNETYYFKGITNSLLPSLRLTQDSNFDAWIDLGAFGATPVAGGGVFYKIWEPLSQEVHLFINEDRPVKLIAEYQLNDERRFHYVYLKTSALADKYHYQFIKNGQYEQLEVANFKTFSPIKVDPMARELTFEAKGGRFNGYINPRGIVAQDNVYNWKNDSAFRSMSALDYNNWIIYQLWPLTFNPKEIDGAYIQGKFLDIIPKIPYLNTLGVNAVELLPVHESRFSASWGYALDSLIILESSLGTKNDMKKLVDEFHASKIRVLFDVVVNHVNNNLIREPLGPNQTSSKFYSGDTPWGPKPRFESVWVRKWITDSLLHIMNEYHVDGFRFDMTDSIFNGTIGGYRFLQELNILMKINNPLFYSSAEQLPNNVWVSFPVAENGLGFDSQWNDRFKNFFELEFDSYTESNRAVDLTHLSNSLRGYSDHPMSPGVYYHFGHPQRTVNYLGSHDFVGNKDPLIRIVSKYRSSEKEGNNTFSRVNPLEEKGDLSEPFRTIHNQFSHSVTRLSYGILFTKPGAALFFQGEELAQDLNIENEWAYVDALLGNRFPSKNVDINKYVRSHRMPWYYYDLAHGRKSPILNFTNSDDMNLFKGQFEFFKEMIKFKKDNPEINNQDPQNVFINNSTKIVTYELKTSTDTYFLVGNYNHDNGEAWVYFPGSSQVWWEEVINSSLPKFGGDTQSYQNIITNLGGRKNLLRLKGAGFYIFKMKNTPGVSSKFYFRSTANNWVANETTELKASPQNQEELSTKVVVTKAEPFEFKIATRGWEVDLGKPITANLRKSAQDFLSYIPHSANIKASLEAGTYKLKFNLRTYAYSFEKINP